MSSNAGSDLSNRPPLDLYTEEGELSDDQDQTVTDQDQPVSEEQNYRDTMQGIRSFMGWSHIPDIDSTATTSEDNPFVGPKTCSPRQGVGQDAYRKVVMQKARKVEPYFG